MVPSNRPSKAQHMSNQLLAQCVECSHGSTSFRGPIGSFEHVAWHKLYFIFRKQRTPAQLT